MDKDFTYIGMLLDRSGSMRGSESEVVGGVNKFLEDQRKVPGRASVTVVSFDNLYELIYEDQDVLTAPNIMVENVSPRGMTALNYSLHRLITSMGAKLAAMPEEKRPSKVIVLIFSDGGENQPQMDVTGEQIRKLVKEQETKYNWKFLFFGMDIDAQQTGGSVGVRGFSASKSRGGIMKAARMGSAYVGNSRMGNTAEVDKLYGSRGIDDPNAISATEDFAKKLSQAKPEDSKP